MSHNPYAPPMSKVADFGSDMLAKRPQSMRIALSLFWMALVLALPSAVMAFLQQIAARSDPPPAFYALLVSVLALAFGLGAGVIVMLGRARNWARIVYTALTGLGLVSTLSSFPEILTRPWYSGPLEILVTVMNVAAVVLSYLPPSNAWFRARGRRVAASRA